MIYVQVLKTQADLGVDVVTDGEMERGAYYMQVEYFLQNIRKALKKKLEQNALERSAR